MIEIARVQAGSDLSRRPDTLRDALEPLSPGEIQAFQNRYDQLDARAANYDLLHVLELLTNSGLEDTFPFVRCWLISQGRDFFSAVVADPQCLAGLSVVYELPAHGCIAAWVYYLKTGDDIERPYLAVEPPVVSVESAAVPERFSRVREAVQRNHRVKRCYCLPSDETLRLADEAEEFGEIGEIVEGAGMPHLACRDGQLVEIDASESGDETDPPDDAGRTAEFVLVYRRGEFRYVQPCDFRPTDLILVRCPDCHTEIGHLAFAVSLGATDCPVCTRQAHAVYELRTVSATIARPVADELGLRSCSEESEPEPAVDEDEPVRH
ncbi:MAG: DUF4240 domain-containing protein [Gammaproteobacteria bacterium]|nr:DUF4240 domain-containing protein [Gammaproteobacteria bacterium]